MSQSYINSGMNVNNTLNVNTLNVTGTSSFLGSATAKNMLNIYGNTNVGNSLTIKNSSLFSKGFSSSSSLNLNNNKIVNLGNPSSDSDLINLNTLNQYQPQYYSYQSDSGDYLWNVGTAYPWLNIPAVSTNYSSNYSDYFGFSDEELLLLKPGLYSFSVYIYKLGGLGNGYGGHLTLMYVDDTGNIFSLGWMYMWNENGQNFPGALVDISFPVLQSGSLKIYLVDNGYFKVQFMSFQIIHYPLS